ncbi:MAG: hypothetical protein N838_35240 [Thiohalocapsa sp. PB-PSB1]|nr:MAG: hypothetical protein N838_35240 [Thiohalocapsa sp. PB-PSB1]
MADLAQPLSPSALRMAFGLLVELRHRYTKACPRRWDHPACTALMRVDGSISQHIDSDHSMTATFPISSQQRRWLKQQAHHLKPVVWIGQAGLSEAVLTEIELALDHHELIKVRVNADQRDAEASAIAAQTRAELVQRIGNVATYFRANPRHKDPMRLPH